MEKIYRKLWFTHPRGEDIYLFTLRNSKGTEVSITSYGATITSFRLLKDNGVVNDIVLGFDKIDGYINQDYLAANPYFGAAIGRYGNRIKEGKFILDGKEYELKQNLGTEHLHGGKAGFDKVVWKEEAVSSNSLTLSYLSKNGEEGYPGNLKVTLRFDLSDDNELSHEYTAVTDQPTPVNLTHHTYFNFDDGKDTIEDVNIKIEASNILEQDRNLTVTGKLIPVAGTPYDFREFKPINKDWNASVGYDQSFVVDKIDDLPKAQAYSEKTGVLLQLFTTEPIVHLYTGKSIPRVTGKDGRMYGPFSGFCLETQIHPNAVNIPHFPNTILRPGETYRHKTTYKILQF